MMINQPHEHSFSASSFAAVSVTAAQSGDWQTAASRLTEGNSGSAHGIAKLAADPYATSQWYLQPNSGDVGADSAGVNIVPVWNDYSGAGVTIGVIDEGFDYSHFDIAANYDTTRDVDQKDAVIAQDARPDFAYHNHGTWVTGVIAADDNGFGVVGVAYDATIAGHYIRFGFGGSTLNQIGAMVAMQADVDVSNNSWGYSTPFSDNFNNSYWSPLINGLETALHTGRDGLGTVMVHAAGNDRNFVAGTSQDGDNVNYHSLLNSRYTIAVAATDSNGDVASFSTPGAALLVSAPGVSMLTTNVTDNDGDIFDDFVYVSGTSFAAPVISGIVATMLEANPDLGWRDVQEILANSAWMTGGADGWQTNGAGFNVSHDFGFGLVDAKAAVRLAENWTGVNTSANEVTFEKAFDIPADNAFVGDLSSKTYTMNISAEEHDDLRIEWVELSIDIAHKNPGDLRITLTSPSEVTSVLMDRPMDGQYAIDDLNFTFSSSFYRGESADGLWLVDVYDEAAGSTGLVQSATLRFFGGDAPIGNAFYVTDSFEAASPYEMYVEDSGGIDTLNFAAYGNGIDIQMTGGFETTLGSRAFTIAAGARIENAIGGDVDDRIVANGMDNNLKGGRGADTIIAGNGDDIVEGGEGDDRISGGGGDDILRGGDGNDQLRLDSGNDAAYGGAGNDIIRVRLSNLDHNDIIDGGAGNADTFYSMSSGLLDLNLPQIFTGIERIGVAAQQVVIGNDDSIHWIGRSGAEKFTLGAGDDIVRAGGGNDIIDGGAGDDIIIGHSGADRITGGQGDDRMAGSSGADVFIINPGDGRDIISDFKHGVDRIDVSAFGFDSFQEDIADHMRTIGGKTVLDFDDGGRILLLGVVPITLDAGDFILG